MDQDSMASRTEDEQKDYSNDIEDSDWYEKFSCEDKDSPIDLKIDSGFDSLNSQLDSSVVKSLHLSVDDVFNTGFLGIFPDLTFSPLFNSLAPNDLEETAKSHDVWIEPNQKDSEAVESKGKQGLNYSQCNSESSHEKENTVQSKNRDIQKTYITSIEQYSRPPMKKLPLLPSLYDIRKNDSQKLNAANEVETETTIPMGEEYISVFSDKTSSMNDDNKLSHSFTPIYDISVSQHQSKSLDQLPLETSKSDDNDQNFQPVTAVSCAMNLLENNDDDTLAKKVDLNLTDEQNLVESLPEVKESNCEVSETNTISPKQAQNRTHLQNLLIIKQILLKRRAKVQPDLMQNSGKIVNRQRLDREMFRPELSTIEEMDSMASTSLDVFPHMKKMLSDVSFSEDKQIGIFDEPDLTLIGPELTLATEREDNLKTSEFESRSAKENMSDSLLSFLQHEASCMNCTDTTVSLLCCKDAS